MSDTEASIRRASARMVGSLDINSPDYATQMQMISDWQDQAYRSARIFVPGV